MCCNENPIEKTDSRKYKLAAIGLISVILCFAVPKLVCFIMSLCGIPTQFELISQEAFTTALLSIIGIYSGANIAQKAILKNTGTPNE